MAKRLTGLLALGTTLAALAAAVAPALAGDALPDPTLPPPEAGLTGPAAPPPAGPVLQSIRIGPGNRSAVISGQLLKEGDLYGEAKLVRITGSEVVLSGPEGEQTLKLFPDVEKTLRSPRAVVPESAATGAKNKTDRNAERKQP